MPLAMVMLSGKKKMVIQLVPLNSRDQEFYSISLLSGIVPSFRLNNCSVLLQNDVSTMHYPWDLSHSVTDVFNYLDWT